MCFRFSDFQDEYRYLYRLSDYHPTVIGYHIEAARRTNMLNEIIVLKRSAT